MPRQIFAIYELDDSGEATGLIHWVCEEHAWSERHATFSGARYSDPEVNTDRLPGTVCEVCEQQ
jgi:hypothetical protein